MTHRIRCTTHFDITATGTKGNYRVAQLPGRDDTGSEIVDQDSWHRSRNQQRNWETVNQLISLRTLPENIGLPVKDGDVWWFEFDVPSLDAVSDDTPLGALLADCDGVPMILGLDESQDIDAILTCHGDRANIWFDVCADK